MQSLCLCDWQFPVTPEIISTYFESTISNNLDDPVRNLVHLRLFWRWNTDQDHRADADSLVLHSVK
jgi:hypothetical protein